MRATKVDLGDGRKIDGQALDFKAEKDEWNIFSLENGGRVRVRVVLTDVILTEEKNSAGDPLVVTKASLIVAYDAPTPENANAH